MCFLQWHRERLCSATNQSPAEPDPQDVPDKREEVRGGQMVTHITVFAAPWYEAAHRSHCTYTIWHREAPLGPPCAPVFPWMEMAHTIFISGQKGQLWELATQSSLHASLTLSLPTCHPWEDSCAPSLAMLEDQDTRGVCRHLESIRETTAGLLLSVEALAALEYEKLIRRTWLPGFPLFLNQSTSIRSSAPAKKKAKPNCPRLGNAKKQNPGYLGQHREKALHRAQ